MSTFKTYLENAAGNNTQQILNYLGKNADRINERPEIKKLLEEIKTQVSKIRTTKTGEKFVSEAMKERNEKALHEISYMIKNKIMDWDRNGLFKKSQLNLKNINKIFEINISEKRAQELIFSRLLKYLSASERKPDKIVSTTKQINKDTQTLIKEGNVISYKKKWFLSDFDFIASPVKNKILSSSLDKKLEIYRKLSGKDFVPKETDFDRIPKDVVATIQRILRDNK